VLIQGRHLIEVGAYLIFPKSWSDMIICCNICMCSVMDSWYVSVPQKSQKDPLSLDQFRNATPLAGLGLLHKGLVGLY